MHLSNRLISYLLVAFHPNALRPISIALRLKETVRPSHRFAVVTRDER